MAHDLAISSIKIDSENNIVFSQSDDQKKLKSWIFDSVNINLILINIESDSDAKIGDLTLFTSINKALITNSQIYDAYLYDYQPP